MCKRGIQIVQSLLFHSFVERFSAQLLLASAADSAYFGKNAKNGTKHNRQINADN